MTFTDRIEVNPHVMLGKAVIRGPRIPVELPEPHEPLGSPPFDRR